MTSTEARTVIDFEKSLTEGKQVRVRWTNCGRYFTGLGHVKKINKHSAIVTLSEPVDCQDLGSKSHEVYPAGQDIKAPLLTMGSGGKLWSCNNRVEPAGYEVCQNGTT